VVFELLDGGLGEFPPIFPKKSIFRCILQAASNHSSNSGGDRRGWDRAVQFSKRNKINKGHPSIFKWLMKNS
jgi:ATP sulfurylase